MTTTNITNFRKNAFDYVEQTIKYNQYHHQGRQCRAAV